MQKVKLLAIGLVMLTAAAACKKDKTEESTGTVRMHLTDGPIDDANVKAVFITVTEINVRVGNKWEPLDGFTGPEKYNLYDLRDSNSVFLGQEKLKAGSYSEIRFVLQAPEDMNSSPSNPGCYIEYKDGSTQPLFVPSGASSGFKAKGNFDVPVNGTVDITADFDVRKSVVESGNSGKYILKPVIRIVVNQQAGSIHGNFVNSTLYTNFVIYAYADGTYTDTEDDDPDSTHSRFPNAVSSTSMSSSGSFSIPYLAPGTYDLAVAAYDINGAFVSVLGFVPNVSVQSKTTATVTVDTGSLSTTP